MKTNKVIIIGAVVVVMAILIKTITYFSFGWETVEVNDFNVQRNSTSQWIANYSEMVMEIDFDGDIYWDTDYWTEPASDISQYSYLNRYEDVTHGFKKPATPMKYNDIKQANLNNITLSVRNYYYLNSKHGNETLLLSNSYVDALRAWKNSKPIFARYHRGKFWSYEIK